MSNVNIFSRFSQKSLFGSDDAVICFFAFETVFETCLTFQYKVRALFCHSRPKKLSIACYSVFVTPKWSLWIFDNISVLRDFDIITVNLWVWGHSRLLIGRDNWSILLFLGGIAIGEWGHPLLIPCINFIICVSLVMVDLIMSKRLSAPFFSHCVNV